MNNVKIVIIKHIIIHFYGSKLYLFKLFTFLIFQILFGLRIQM